MRINRRFRLKKVHTSFKSPTVILMLFWLPVVQKYQRWLKEQNYWKKKTD